MGQSRWLNPPLIPIDYRKFTRFSGTDYHFSRLTRHIRLIPQRRLVGSVLRVQYYVCISGDGGRGCVGDYRTGIAPCSPERLAGRRKWLLSRTLVDRQTYLSIWRTRLSARSNSGSARSQADRGWTIGIRDAANCRAQRGAALRSKFARSGQRRGVLLGRACRCGRWPVYGDHQFPGQRISAGEARI